MRSVVVLVGSKRPAKVEGVREALAAIARVDSRFADVVLDAHDLTHIAPRQPMSIAEIIDGARTRAAALLNLGTSDSEPRNLRTPEPPNPGTSEPRNPGTPELRNPGTPELRFAVGVEGGLERLPTGTGAWALHSWAAVTDGESWGYGGGPALMLPPEIAERVVSGEELGDVIDRLAGEHVRGTRGAWGLLTRDLIGRREAFRLAVIAAFAPFYNALHWDSLRRREASES
jgi:non-canonical (house-cleaning) NTP pyrophosphatase